MKNPKFAALFANGKDFNVQTIRIKQLWNGSGIGR